MISVCLATYNGEEYIKEQLLSILMQLDGCDEVVISDDHSTDKTIDIIKSIHDDRIKIIMNEGEKGYTSNFQNALLYAKGNYIFLCDQDDIWINSKVKCCLEYLQDYDFVVSDAIIINHEGTILASSYFQKRKIYSSLLGNIYKFGFLGCCMAFKKEVLKKALPFPKNHKYCTHDNWLFLVAKMFYTVKITSRKLIYYRRHMKNASTGGFSNKTSFHFKLIYRFYLLFHLMKLAFR